ncbi:MAG: hypothetical protein JXL67_07175 [Calditrichaeota bacterium]|nr:hypothetical protein [Calditrichota bacterium]
MKNGFSRRDHFVAACPVPDWRAFAGMSLDVEISHKLFKAGLLKNHNPVLSGGLKPLKTGHGQGKGHHRMYDCRWYVKINFDIPCYLQPSRWEGY